MQVVIKITKNVKFYVAAINKLRLEQKNHQSVHVSRNTRIKNMKFHKAAINKLRFKKNRCVHSTRIIINASSFIQPLIRILDKIISLN